MTTKANVNRRRIHILEEDLSALNDFLKLYILSLQEAYVEMKSLAASASKQKKMVDLFDHNCRLTTLYSHLQESSYINTEEATLIYHAINQGLYDVVRSHPQLHGVGWLVSLVSIFQMCSKHVSSLGEMEDDYDLADWEVLV